MLHKMEKLNGKFVILLGSMKKITWTNRNPDLILDLKFLRSLLNI